MRVSSCFLLCLLSASLVSGITILDVPAQVTVSENNDEISQFAIDGNVKEYEIPNYDAESDSDSDSSSGRRLLRSINPQVIHKIVIKHVPSPAPAPKPAPAPAPKSDPKPAPAPVPKPAPAPAPAPKPATKSAPAPAPKPKSAPAVIIKVSMPDAKSVPVMKSPVYIQPVIAVKSEPAASVLPIFVTCDNEFDLYVNGNKIGRGTSWTTTYQFNPLVKSGDVIAIDGVDQGGPAAFIGVFGGKVTKPSEWRCSTKESTGWNKNNFDDSSWTMPVSYGRNQDNNVWRSVGGGSRPNIPADAEWLWTSDNNNHNRVYCRYFPSIAQAPVASPVAAPKQAPVAAPVASPVAAANKRAVIDEIISTNKNTNVKLTKFQEKLVAIMKETSDEQVKIESENRNNYNGVSATLQNEQIRLESARAEMKKLYDETARLNISIQTHYKKLIADAEYLQSLDAIRPAFLKSLGELASHIQAVKMIVNQKLVKDEYKDEMIGVLTDIHFKTHNISGYVATAFVNHYNKYKNLIQKENADYSTELKQLTLLSNNYKIQAQKTADIEKERVRLQDILTKLKDTLTLSVSQREDFDLLVRQVISIFDNRCSVAPVLR